MGAGNPVRQPLEPGGLLAVREAGEGVGVVVGEAQGGGGGGAHPAAWRRRWSGLKTASPAIVGARRQASNLKASV